MSLPRKKPSGVVLPALILISLVLLVLVSTLVSTGTSSLRATTYGQQSDVATYAAEVGLVQAVEDYRKDGKLPRTYAGKVETNGATFLVTKYENMTTEEMQVPGGPIIPPSTLYLLSEGVTSNGTRQKAGALFRTGLGLFQAGIVSESLSAEKSAFDAYDSRVSLDPAGSAMSDRGILASNRFDPATADPQFTLADTSVKGGVFVAPGTTPAEQVRKSGTTVVSRESTLASPITIEAIEVPDLAPGVAEGGETTGGTFDEASYRPPSWRLFQGAASDLKVHWDRSRRKFVFIDDGGYFGDETTVATLTVAQMRAASEGSPPKWTGSDGEGRVVTINFASGKVTYQDPHPRSGLARAQSEIPALFSDALNPEGVKTQDPDRLGHGSYESVTISDSTPTRLDEGTYKVGDLIISGQGQLQLPADKAATIYVTGELRAEGNNAILNDSQLPTNLKIFYIGDKPVNLSGGSRAYLTLIAPKAEVKMEGLDPANPTLFYGALVGKSVKVINTAFHFDVATDGVGTGTDGSPLSLLNRHRL